ncbi:hypothetical protein FGO68_gene673 [Halteria grandinella]|uniref:cDENN domain-containing protein n=1 Tax=Halteria grandinella TaxID=5974 RepID=A0A8J8P3A0_HALGN|nr:hypothetical protein FGO68_gene673 [Halteria grandinella]
MDFSPRQQLTPANSSRNIGITLTKSTIQDYLTSIPLFKTFASNKDPPESLDSTKVCESCSQLREMLHAMKLKLTDSKKAELKLQERVIELENLLHEEKSQRRASVIATTEATTHRPFMIRSNTNLREQLYSPMAATLGPAFRRIIRFSDASVVGQSIREIPEAERNHSTGGLEEVDEDVRVVKMSVLDHPVRNINDTYIQELHSERDQSFSLAKNQLNRDTFNSQLQSVTVFDVSQSHGYDQAVYAKSLMPIKEEDGGLSEGNRLIQESKQRYSQMDQPITQLQLQNDVISDEEDNFRQGPRHNAERESKLIRLGNKMYQRNTGEIGKPCYFFQDNMSNKAMMESEVLIERGESFVRGVVLPLEEQEPLSYSQNSSFVRFDHNLQMFGSNNPDKEQLLESSRRFAFKKPQGSSRYREDLIKCCVNRKRACSQNNRDNPFLQEQQDRIGGTVNTRRFTYLEAQLPTEHEDTDQLQKITEIYTQSVKASKDRVFHTKSDSIMNLCLHPHNKVYTEASPHKPKFSIFETSANPIRPQRNLVAASIDVGNSPLFDHMKSFFKNQKQQKGYPTSKSMLSIANCSNSILDILQAIPDCTTFSQPQHFLELVLSIGISQRALQDVQDDMCYVESSNLEFYPNNAQNIDLMDQSGRFLKEFCFPHGIRVEKMHIKVDQEGKVDVQDYRQIKRIKNLFYKQKDWRQRVVNTILKPKQQSKEEKFRQLNCMCVTIDELVIREGDGQVFLVQKMICCLSWNCFFSLQIQIMSVILDELKRSKLEVFADLESQISNELENIITSSIISSKCLLTSTAKHFLAQVTSPTYASLADLSDQSYTFILYDDNNLPQEELTYTFPITMGDLEQHWFFPSICQMLSSTQIVQLITSLLLEDSIIIVGDNIPLLSNIVLGLEQLVKPLVCRFHIIPILSDEQLDMLEMPLPILTGITEISYSILRQQGFNKQKNQVWVFLEQGGSVRIDGAMSETKWIGKRYQSAIEALIQDYKGANNEIQEQARPPSRLVEYIGRPSVSPKRIIQEVIKMKMPILTPSEEQLNIITQLSECLRTLINERILSMIPDTRFDHDFSQLHSMSDKVEYIRLKTLENSTHLPQHQFMDKFVYSQIFSDFVAETFNLF